ncbi:AzlC family ABC transporter permease [Collinsella sp. AGMB00827]|uniref:AzlC family ABC transporter permease n=1 Tax=Collinsella ureilytica TaxID=2869515 RepID=A0ABS7MIB4_9ACTN|nr:AzlC family ABC transporter permease [Collinsella urealyticum]MBY4797099.1 AzlC family ABC transporter permease [Collinsella urealyticum]
MSVDEACELGCKAGCERAVCTEATGAPVSTATSTYSAQHSSQASSSKAAHPSPIARLRSRSHIALPALAAAFPLTTPIMAGFILTGITCGVFVLSLGLPWWAPTLMSIAIFAGSSEFVVASLLLAPFNPIQTFITVFIVNARHLFYGLPLLERFRTFGAKRLYMVYALCDESFSLQCTRSAPEGIDEGWFMFWISLLNQAWWVIGCTLGALVGHLLPTGVDGVSFAMTALFVVIFLDQVEHERTHIGAYVGFAAAVVSLLILGPESFLIPALALILGSLLFVRAHVEPTLDEEAS